MARLERERDRVVQKNEQQEVLLRDTIQKLLREKEEQLREMVQQKEEQLREMQQQLLREREVQTMQMV